MLLLNACAFRLSHSDKASLETPLCKRIDSYHETSSTKHENSSVSYINRELSHSTVDIQAIRFAATFSGAFGLLEFAVADRKLATLLNEGTRIYKDKKCHTSDPCDIELFESVRESGFDVFVPVDACAKRMPRRIHFYDEATDDDLRHIVDEYKHQMSGRVLARLGVREPEARPLPVLAEHQVDAVLLRRHDKTIRSFLGRTETPAIHILQSALCEEAHSIDMALFRMNMSSWASSNHHPCCGRIDASLSDWAIDGSGAVSRSSLEFIWNQLNESGNIMIRLMSLSELMSLEHGTLRCAWSEAAVANVSSLLEPDITAPSAVLGDHTDTEVSPLLLCFLNAGRDGPCPLGENNSSSHGSRSAAVLVEDGIEMDGDGCSSCTLTYRTSPSLPSMHRDVVSLIPIGIKPITTINNGSCAVATCDATRCLEDLLQPKRVFSLLPLSENMTSCQHSHPLNVANASIRKRFGNSHEMGSSSTQRADLFGRFLEASRTIVSKSLDVIPCDNLKEYIGLERSSFTRHHLTTFGFAASSLTKESTEHLRTVIPIYEEKAIFGIDSCPQPSIGKPDDDSIRCDKHNHDKACIPTGYISNSLHDSAESKGTVEYGNIAMAPPQSSSNSMGSEPTDPSRDAREGDTSEISEKIPDESIPSISASVALPSCRLSALKSHSQLIDALMQAQRPNAHISDKHSLKPIALDNNNRPIDTRRADVTYTHDSHSNDQENSRVDINTISVDRVTTELEHQNNPHLKNTAKSQDSNPPPSKSNSCGRNHTDIEHSIKLGHSDTTRPAISKTAKNRGLKGLKILISPDMLDSSPETVGRLHAVHGIECIDCAIQEPISVIVDAITAVAVVDGPSLSDGGMYRSFLHSLTKQVFRYASLWVIVTLPGDVGDLMASSCNVTMARLGEALSDFPLLSRAVRPCTFDALPDAIASICTFASCAYMARIEVLLPQYLKRSHLDAIAQHRLFGIQCEFLQLFPTINLYTASRMLATWPIRQLVCFSESDLPEITKAISLHPEDVQKYILPFLNLLHTYCGGIRMP